MFKKGDLTMYEEFEEFNEEGIIYCGSIPEFEFVSCILPVDEVGLSFNGEVKVDDNTSVITDKQIKVDSPQNAINTYVKVMEMRDLTEIEREKVSKVKFFLKKLFEVFFRNNKWRVYYTIMCSTFIAFDIWSDNFFGVLLMTACIALNTSPVKFAKEIKKVLGNKKRKEELSEELLEMNMLGAINSVDNDGEILLYVKPKVPNM